MNRQEAIKTLQKLQADYNDKYIDYEGANDAYNMVIEDMQRCQRIDNKLANAVPTKWPAEGFCDFEDDDGEDNV